MANYDRLTRRDFLSRVTTLVGGVALASSGLALAGCGSGNNNNGNNNTLSTPSANQIGTSPGGAKLADVTPLSHQVGLTVTATQTDAHQAVTATDPTSVANTLATLAASTTTTAPSPGFGVAVQQSTGTFTIIPLGTTTGSLQDSTGAFVTPSAFATAVANYLTALTSLPASQGGITISSGDKYVYNTYTYGNQQTISVPAIVDSTSGKIVFDPVLSMLPPPQTSTITGSVGTVTNPYVDTLSTVSGSTGTLGQNQYNPASGTLLFSIGAAATAGAGSGGALTITNSKVGTPTTGPGVSISSQNITSRAVPVGTGNSRQSGSSCITVVLTFTVTMTLTLPSGATVVLWTLTVTITVQICITGSSGQG